MIRVTVDSIRVSLLTQNRVVVLREVDSRRYLPIFIGPFEADAIAIALQGLEPQRPMTHDLLKAVFGELGASLRYILVNDLRDGTFYARIVVNQGAHTLEIDSRPSDAIALAVRSDVPIYVEPHVFEQASTPFEDEEAGTSADTPANLPASTPAAAASSTPAPTGEEPETEISDEGLSIFRDFINSLDRDKDEGKKEK